jgi:hypothetical protein
MMSRLSKLLGQPKECTIGGETFTIHPLKIGELDLILGLENEKTRGQNLKKIICITLKRAVPDATDDEIDRVAITHFRELTEAIMEVNGLETPPSANVNPEQS